MRLEKGEECYHQVKVTWQQSKKDDVTGKDVLVLVADIALVAAGAGGRVFGGKNQVKIIEGILYVTNKRMFVVGEGNAHEVKLDDIIHTAYYPDRLEIIRKGNVPETFAIKDGYSQRYIDMVIRIIGFKKADNIIKKIVPTAESFREAAVNFAGKYVKPK